MTTIWIGGIHAVNQALTDNKILKLQIVQNKKSKNLLKLLDLAKTKNIEIEFVEFYALDLLLPDIKHQGVAGLIQLEGKFKSWQEAIAGKEKPLILVLDSIQDPHNLGACLRSALGFNVDAVLIPKNNAADISSTVHQVSCGAAQILPIFKVVNLRQEIKLMKEKGIWILAADMKGENLYNLDLQIPLAIIMGNEEKGIQHLLKEDCDFIASIPINPKLESLNVSVATAVILAEIGRQKLC